MNPQYIIIPLLYLILITCICWPWVKTDNTLAQSRLMGRTVAVETDTGVSHTLDTVTNTITFSLDQNIDTSADFVCHSLSLADAGTWVPSIILNQGLSTEPTAIRGAWAKTQYIVHVFLEIQWNSVSLDSAQSTLRIPIPENLAVSSTDLTFHQDTLLAPLNGVVGAQGFNASFQSGSIDYYADTSTQQYQLLLLFDQFLPVETTGRVFAQMSFRAR